MTTQSNDVDEKNDVPCLIYNRVCRFPFTPTWQYFY